jgi:long-chain acyl-CoA synthetase
LHDFRAAGLMPFAGMIGEMAQRFQWHPSARVAGADGVMHAAGNAAAVPVIAEKPGVSALQGAFASAEAGLAFRIGGAGGAPDAAPGATPMFETLSGGSTGTPRRILRSHASWIASFHVNAMLFGIGPGSRVAVLGALSHSLALYAAIEALHLGADLHLLVGCSPSRQCREMRARGVQVLYATPVQLRMLTEANVEKVPGVRRLLVGGGALDGALRGRLRQVFPAATVQTFYGAAETSFIAISNDHTPDGAAGAPYPGADIAVRDKSCENLDGKPGVIWVRSPYLASGYAGADIGSGQWLDGWVSVGEWGRMNNGQLTVLGRASRMVRIADQSVFPEEIEAFLLVQPGVQDAAVLPRPDARRGQILEAVLRGDPLMAQAILSAVRQRFGVMAAPRQVHWRTDWPLLPSGKPDLTTLMADLP